MPPTFTDGLRRPNSLIRRRVCAFLTQDSSLLWALKAAHANLSRQLRGWPVECAIYLIVIQVEHEDRIADLRDRRMMAQVSAQSRKPEPLELFDFLRCRSWAVVCGQSTPEKGSRTGVRHSVLVTPHLCQHAAIMLFVTHAPRTELQSVNTLQGGGADAVNTAG